MEWPIVLSLPMGAAGEAVAAILIGIGFGFVLERAGFGRADNLASIFYGRDFRVMRVMFTAIVTAMLGLYFLDLSGVMPLGNIGLLPTYLLPQLVGGLLLGVGFVIGGYCPGTSIVATVSGKIDGLFFIAGLFGGGILFTLGYESMASFHNSTSWGRVLLAEYFGVPSGVMIFVVVLFAAGAFVVVNKIEARINAKLQQGESPETDQVSERDGVETDPSSLDKAGGHSLISFHFKIGAIVFLGLGGLYTVVALATGHSASAHSPPAPPSAKSAGINHWQALSLILKRQTGLVICDVRSAEQFSLYSLPNAISMPDADAKEIQKKAANGRPIVIIANNDDQAVKLVGRIKQINKAQSAYYLKGGIRSWYLALELPVPLFSNKPPPPGYREAIEAIRTWLGGKGLGSGQIAAAIKLLAGIEYNADQLQNNRAHKTAGKKKKKITGGCG